MASNFHNNAARSLTVRGAGTRGLLNSRALTIAASASVIAAVAAADECLLLRVHSLCPFADCLVLQKETVHATSASHLEPKCQEMDTESGDDVIKT